MSVGRFAIDTIKLANNTPDLQMIQEYLVPTLYEINDTGVADTLNTIRHGLNRIPRGVRIINVALPAADAPAAVGWYRKDNGGRELTDDVWDITDLRIRFSHDNLRVLLEIF